MAKALPVGVLEYIPSDQWTSIKSSLDMTIEEIVVETHNKVENNDYKLHR